MELRQKGRRLAVEVAPRAKRAKLLPLSRSDVAGIPAVCHNRSQAVFSLPYPRGDIVAVIVGALRIVAPPGRQIAISYLCSVKLEFEDSQGARVEMSSRNLFPCLETFPIVTGRRKVELKGVSMQRLFILEGNPLCLPVSGAKKAHRKMGGLAPGGGNILLIPDLNLPEDPPPGLKGLFPLIENEVVAGTPCLPRIPQVALIAGQGGFGTGRQDTIGPLGFPFSLRFETPAQAGNRRMQAGWIGSMLTG